MRRVLVLAMSLALIASSAAAVAPGPAAAGNVIDLAVTGRFVYLDAAGTQQPIGGAKVEACDYDGIWPFDCDHGSNPHSTGRTNPDGTFHLTFSGGDLEGPADLYVRVYSETAAGSVTLETGVALIEYCMATAQHDDFSPGAGWVLDVGTVSPDNARPCSLIGGFTNLHDEHVAWQQLHFLNEVRAVADSLVGPLPKVAIIWPSTLSGVPFYTGELDHIRMVPGHEDDRLTLYHEYGHHVLDNLAESPIPDYNNKVCDETSPLRFLPFFGGHCFWRAERGSIHWTEGVPDFWAEVVETLTFPGTTGIVYGVDTNNDGTNDVNVTSEHPYLPNGSSPSGDDPHDLVEAWTHIVLRDLWDGGVDNHDAASDANGALESDSADRVQLGFDQLWDVILSDPDPANPFHDHPTTLAEFRELLVAAHPELENRINAVFTENGMFQHGADLGVRDVTASATTVVRGQSITVGDTTFNDAAAQVATGEESRTRYTLDYPYSWQSDVDLGSRIVPPLGPGASATGDRSVTIPTTAEPGTYKLVACADGEHDIYESAPPGEGTSMVANCADGPRITIANRAPIADAGGPYRFDEGTGGALDGSRSSDADGDVLTYAWTGDILAGPTDTATAALRPDVDDGVYDVSLQVSDAYRGSSTDTVKVVVANVAPKLDVGGKATLSEGDTFVRTISVTDPVDSAFDAAVDWGDGTGVHKLGQVATSFDVTNTFRDDARGTITICVDDGDDSTCDTVDLRVSNVAPTLADDPIVAAGVEGTAIEAQAAFADPGADAWAATIAWGDGSPDTALPLGSRSLSLGHAYAQDGSYHGSVCIADDDGGSDCATLEATIANAPPVITSVVVTEPVVPLVEATVTVAFSDPGLLDPHTATMDWGDGAAIDLGAVSSPWFAAHTFGAAGEVTSRVCVADDDATTCTSRAVRVMSVADAAERTIDDLMALGSGDAAIAAAIGALDGTIASSSSGALDKMLAGDWVAAVAKLGAAVAALGESQADQTSTQAPLTRVAEAIARERLAEVDARGFTAKGALRQVASIRNAIDAGRRLYLAGSYLAAIDQYRAATQTAVDLLRVR